MKTIHTPHAPEAIGPYSQAVVHGGFLFTSGQIAINPASGRVEADAIEGQAEQVMKNLAALLEAAGSSFGNVVKTTCFLSDMADFAVFNGIYERYFVGRPARSCVAAKELPKGVLVEVELIAAVEE
jgi:putative endoribonuclease L-PSP